MFHKYPSIENSYRQKTVNLIREMGLANKSWCVTCKVHGANYSVYYNKAEKKLSYAKRSGFIGEGESFYSHEAMIDREESKFVALFEELDRDAVLCGELCGGYFPGVEQSNERCIQKGVWYSPKTEFYCFDIFTDNTFMNVSEAMDLCAKHNILHAKPLMYGTLDQCLEYPNAYDDPISGWLGYPVLKDNVCEGNVIKPVDALYFDCGSRIILKNKNEIFQEVKQGSKPKKDISYDLSEDATKVYNFLSAYITENRLRNVLSKIGDVTNKDFGKILGLFTQDALDEGKKDGSNLNELSKTDQKLVKRHVSGLCSTMLRENIVNIIDGNF